MASTELQRGAGWRGRASTSKSLPGPLPVVEAAPLNGEGRTGAGSRDLGLEVRKIQRAAGEGSGLVSGLVQTLK